MKKQFLDYKGLTTFIEQIKNIFAMRKDLEEVKANTDPYIFDIDYSLLEFNTDMIVSGGASSATIGIGQLGTMILGS